MAVTQGAIDGLAGFVVQAAVLVVVVPMVDVDVDLGSLDESALVSVGIALICWAPPCAPCRRTPRPVWGFGAMRWLGRHAFI